MNAKRAPQRAKELARGDYGLVLYARLAVKDTINGTNHAAVRAGRKHSLPDAQDVVCTTYAHSSGRVGDAFECFECIECGSVFRGREKADECCDDSIGDDDWREKDEEDEEGDQD